MSEELDNARRLVHALIGLNGLNLPVQNRNGEKFVVVALEREPLPVLIERVRQAGGYANVFVQMSDFLIQFGVVESADSPSEDPSKLEIYQDNTATIGTFVEFLTQTDSPVGIELIPGTSPLRAGETKILSAV